MKWLRVEKSGPINGTINIPGSKNSSLAILTATLLSDDKVTLHNIPKIYDNKIICELMKKCGADVLWQNDEIVIHPQNVQTGNVDPVKSSTYRASYYFIGALLKKMKKVTIGYPGGDNFVSRPIDQHIKALTALGATVTFKENEYIIEAEKLVGAQIYFDTITSGATMNTIMAAVLAEGKTILKNAARDPEVVDLANFLNHLGAKITGAGTHTITIVGVNKLKGGKYSVIPDRLIAGAFLMFPGLNRGRITVNNVIPDHLSSCISKLREIGLKIDIGLNNNSITSTYIGPLKATRIRTGMYPLFPTDLQQPMTALLLKAHGKSIISEKVYPHRFNHCSQLLRLGAKIEVKQGVSFVSRSENLKGAVLKASDVRAGTCLIMAGAMSEGATIISGVEHLERGYDDILRSFRSIGIKISMFEGESPFENDAQNLDLNSGVPFN
ncbi:UDP-N-acetylglucosamine 1-carboxyvinyltransferase [Bacillus spongiae]|uniref:UDP-N-acetylglucosamine 1-carboxyvinyltransferase n=1 Tax=Bacillus spongiae TaxID=2683610 RepID=A0ABU8HE59_9BACI